MHRRRARLRLRHRRKTELIAAKGSSHSLSLDVHAQWATMEKTGQWRFTRRPTWSPPSWKPCACTKRKVAFAGRGARYTENRDVLVDGMRELGFETLLRDRWLSPIIVTFFNPAHAKFDFARFYDLMKARGFIIYPGKLTVVDSFRVGCIGQMDDHTMRAVVAAAKSSLDEMGVDSADHRRQPFRTRKTCSLNTESYRENERHDPSGRHRNGRTYPNPAAAPSPSAWTAANLPTWTQRSRTG